MPIFLLIIALFFAISIANNIRNKRLEREKRIKRELEEIEKQRIIYSNFMKLFPIRIISINGKQI